MHELAICESIVEAVLKEMRTISPPPRRLLRTRVAVGVLRQIVPEYLAFAYEELTKGTAAEGSALELIHLPVAATCRRCGWQGEKFEDIFQCKECGSGNVMITGGTELYLESLEVEQDEQPQHQGLS